MDKPGMLLLSLLPTLLLPLLWGISVRKTLFRPVSIVLLGLWLGFAPLTILLALGKTLTLRSYPLALCKLFLPLLIALTLFWAVSNFVLVRKEGYRLRNIAGTLVGCFYVAGSVCALLLSRSSLPPFFGRLAALGVDYGSCVLFSVGLMALLAAKHKPRHDKDYIIILGCSIGKSGGLLPLLKSRTNRAIRFAWEQEIDTGKSCRFIPSGGQGSDEIMPEATAMELYLLSHAAENYEILPEKESTTTRENFLFSQKLINGINPDAVLAFSTTNYHVLRGGLIARSLGIDCEGIGSGTTWYFWPNGFARELVALFVITKKWQLALIPLLCLLSVL